MIEKQNSRTAPPSATKLTCAVPVTSIEALDDVIDRTDGLSAKTAAALHLSALLVDVIERKFGPSAGQPGRFEGSRTIEIHSTQWVELQWLVGEVWDTCRRIDALTLELIEYQVEISNAGYEARKGLKAVAA